MPKLQRNYRISTEVDQLLKFEAARMTEELGKKTSEADVIEMAVRAWMVVAENDDVNTPILFVNTDDAEERRIKAKIALGEAEAKTPEEPKPSRRAESVAQRKAREAKEHREKLAECDTSAREMGRTDIEYDLENVPYRSVLHVSVPVNTPAERKHYEVAKRKVKPLTRPHGSTEAKRRREQS